MCSSTQEATVRGIESFLQRGLAFSSFSLYESLSFIVIFVLTHTDNSIVVRVKLFEGRELNILHLRMLLYVFLLIHLELCSSDLSIIVQIGSQELLCQFLLHDFLQVRLEFSILLLKG